MAKSILDQTAAWILGVMFSGVFFGGTYMVVKIFAYKDAKEAKNIDSAEIMDEFFEETPSSMSESELKTELGGDVKLAQNPHKETDSASIAADKSSLKKSVEGVDFKVSNPVNDKKLAWSYSGRTGPDFWGDIEKDFVDCRIGRKQSPVNLVRARLEYQLKPFLISYQSVKASISNHPYFLKLEVKSPHSVVRNQDRYALKHIDLHLPSEHLVDGLPYDGEIQFWHDGKHSRLVVAVFIEETGKENPVLKKWIDSSPGNEVSFGIDQLGGMSGGYFSYPGSGTSPPCQENVDWIVFKKAWSISTGQVNQLVRRYKSNARRAQGLFKREVTVSSDFSL